MENRFLRNKDLINQKNLEEGVTVIGAGGIGSALITLMSIMGFKDVVIFDDASVEEHNRSTTLYPKGYVGKSKVLAAEEAFMSYGDVEQKILPLEQRWNGANISSLNNIVFMGPDNMKTREGVYLKWVDNPRRKLLVDMRMGALGMEIVTVTKNNDYFWEDFIEDGTTEPEACTMKHTIFCANIVAGIGLTQAFSFLQNIPFYAYINLSLTPTKLQNKHLIIGD